MNNFICGLTNKQIGIAFNIFYRDGNGEIINEEFLRFNRGKMNPAKQTIVRIMNKKIKSDVQIIKAPQRII
jgi:hypothetical protein